MDNSEIPTEIKEAAMAVENWFKSQGIADWQLLGCCSRTHAFRLYRIKKAMDALGYLTDED